MLNKEAVKDAFSRSAATYDIACDFQREAGLILLDKLLKDSPAAGRVLDVGMGTGNIAARLSGGAGVVVHGCDIAWGMALFAKKNTENIFVAQADAEQFPYKDSVFDVVFSNIAYQWMRDLRASFCEVNRVLKRGGRFYFSVLLKGSLAELYQALDAADKNNLTDMLPDAASLRSALSGSGLRICRWEEMRLKKFYDGCLGLVKTLRSVGADRARGLTLFKMGERRAFYRMVDFYDSNFIERGKTFATYNVAIARADKI